MGIFDRFRRVVKSNLNDMISKAENPEKMLNQLIVDMNQQLIEAKKSVAGAIADEKKLERQVKENLAAGAEWERKAMLAVRAGKDDLAREALIRKQEFDKTATQYKEQWEAQHEAVEKLKTALRSLQAKIEEAQRKKNLIIARSKRAEAQRKINETIGGLSDTSAFEAFEQMSKRMDQLEAENDAMAEIEHFTTGGDNLEQQFAQLEGGSSNTDAMLEDLKKRVAIEDKRDGGSAASGAGAGAGAAGASGGASGTSGGTATAGDDVDDELEKLKKKLQEDF
ncbi:MAG: PspA/IM30 family protein [Spirochaetaceae bacterium]|nr:MAG: PspA/IM30 family protein [Spirochaetaceae bacterium]